MVHRRVGRMHIGVPCSSRRPWDSRVGLSAGGASGCLKDHPSGTGAQVCHTPEGRGRDVGEGERQQIHPAAAGFMFFVSFFFNRFAIRNLRKKATSGEHPTGNPKCWCCVPPSPFPASHSGSLHSSGKLVKKMLLHAVSEIAKSSDISL